jgi:hypothetical protein
MASQQGWYWIGAGMLALGLTSGTANYPGEWMRGLRDQVVATAERASAETVAHLNLARSAWCERQAPSEIRPGMAMARVDARMASLHASLERRQAEVERVQAAKIRMINRQMRAVAVVCPRQKIVVRVPALPPAPGEGTL